MEKIREHILFDTEHLSKIKINLFIVSNKITAELEPYPKRIRKHFQALKLLLEGTVSYSVSLLQL